MRRKTWIGAASSVLLMAGAAIAAAQSAGVHARTPDSRWYPWLGCWAADSAGGGMATECVVPASGGAGVDLVSIVDGKIAERDRLDASGRPHEIRVDGCDGTESSQWSENGRRLFVRSSYACGGGITGTSTRLFSLLANGDWLDVTDVRSGGGSLVHVDRRHDAGIPASIPRDVAAELSGRRLVVATARANAAAPITVDDVLEAVRATSAPTVRAWLINAKQRFSLDSRQLSALTSANVPPSVLRVMLGSTVDDQRGEQAYGSSASDEYLSTPMYSPGSAGVSLPIYGVSPIMTCATVGCYSGAYGSEMYAPGAINTYPSYVPYPVYTTPYLIVHGRQHYGRPARPVAPAPRAPVGRRPR